jgi:hypothetical protein
VDKRSTLNTHPRQGEDSLLAYKKYWSVLTAQVIQVGGITPDVGSLVGTAT